MDIEPIKPEDIPACVSLISTAFDGYVGYDYSREGKDTFYRFVNEEALLERFGKGNLMVCARENGRIVGFQEVRDTNHVCLFFVDPEYHFKGIGRALFEHSLGEIRRKHPGVKKITVNSSIYAEPIYAKLGFLRTAPVQEKDGITYVPMKYSLRPG
jgi:GNAT superfamily N-acetyltransferase